MRFNSTEVALASGDLLVFASDGVEEARNADEEFVNLVVRCNKLIHLKWGNRMLRGNNQCKIVSL